MGIAKKLKLYRGIKSREFSFLTPDLASELDETWARLLERRARGDFEYPSEMNDRILTAAKTLRFQRQYFTDRREIALAYAKSHEGILIEIEVPLKEIQEQFSLEFQNFGRRKGSFEIVYAVESRALRESARRWKLRVLDLAARK